jgi:hypothetical protein
MNQTPFPISEVPSCVLVHPEKRDEPQEERHRLRIPVIVDGWIAHRERSAATSEVSVLQIPLLPPGGSF